MQIKNKDIIFCVNSTKNFYQISLEKNLKSLNESGLDKSIMVIIGGFDDPQEASETECKLRKVWNLSRIYCVSQNSCDHTAFNFLIQRPEAFAGFNYMFYMHDTSWVGKKFLDKLKLYTPEHEVDSYGLTGSWSMNIGLYNIEYLLSKKDEVKKALNNDNSPDSVNAWKQWGALTEDYLMNKEHGNYSNHESLESVKMENPYGQDTVRRTRYFHVLDLYKSQSNWNGVQPEMNKAL
jgi:hypothetical protein